MSSVPTNYLQMASQGGIQAQRELAGVLSAMPKSHPGWGVGSRGCSANESAPGITWSNILQMKSWAGPVSWDCALPHQPRQLCSHGRSTWALAWPLGIMMQWWITNPCYFGLLIRWRVLSFGSISFNGKWLEAQEIYLLDDSVNSKKVSRAEFKVRMSLWWIQKGHCNTFIHPGLIKNSQVFIHSLFLISSQENSGPGISPTSHSDLIQ